MAAGGGVFCEFSVVTCVEVGVKTAQFKSEHSSVESIAVVNV
jgi:hypothetical protein